MRSPLYLSAFAALVAVSFVQAQLADVCATVALGSIANVDLAAGNSALVLNAVAAAPDGLVGFLNGLANVCLCVDALNSATNNVAQVTASVQLLGGMGLPITVQVDLNVPADAAIDAVLGANTEGGACRRNPSLSPTSPDQCTCAQPSTIARKRRLAQTLMLTGPKSECPNKKTRCPIAGMTDDEDAFECLDTRVELESCGGCASIGSGLNCMEVAKQTEGVDTFGMQCIKSKCTVTKCKAGYRLSVRTQSCVPF